MKIFFGFEGGEELPDTAWKPPAEVAAIMP